MGFVSANEGAAASTYLILYVIYLGLVFYIVYREGWRTIYSFFIPFGLFRTAGQLCGVAFAALGFDHWQWLIAYLVFTAEGYFVLILNTFHFVAKAQTDAFGHSWIRPSKKEISERQDNASNIWEKRKAWFTLARVFHLLLIPSNAILIAGGSMLAGMDVTNPDNHHKIITSKILRTVGQSFFLGQTVFAIAIAVYCAIKERLFTSLYVKSVLVAAPFLLVRGIFGIMSIYIDKMNYFDMQNYTSSGLSSQFIAYEYCLATTMEFVAGIIYISIYFLDRSTKRYAEMETIERAESLDYSAKDTKS